MSCTDCAPSALVGRRSRKAHGLNAAECRASARVLGCCPDAKPKAAGVEPASERTERLRQLSCRSGQVAVASWPDGGLVSRKVRKPPRRERHRTKTTISEAPPPPVTVTIVTYPNTDEQGRITVRSDVDLVKAALLYADRVELVSVSSSLLTSLMTFSEGGEDALVALLSELPDENVRALGGAKLPENWREILPFVVPLMRSPMAESLGLGDTAREFQSMMDGVLPEIQRIAEGMVADAGLDELRPALDAGVVTLTGVDGVKGNLVTSSIETAMRALPAKYQLGAPQDGPMDEYLAGWLRLLTTRLQDSRSRLLFDSGVGSLAQSMVDEGWVTGDELALSRAGQAAIGSGLVARLPAFPSARMADLLDLRTDMAAPLIRYRAAVGEFEKTTASTFDDRMSVRVDELWASGVQPSMIDLREQFMRHSLVKEIARSAAEDVKAYIATGPAIFLGMNSMTGLGGLVSASAGLAAPAGAALVRGAAKRSDHRFELKRHKLFYLYEANRRLGG